MYRIKRILSLLMCLMIVFAGIPATQLVVNGADNRVVSVDKITKYDTVDDVLADGWSGGDLYLGIGIDDKGYVSLNQSTQTILNASGTGANAAFSGVVTYKLPAGVVAADDANRTKIITEDGKYTGNLQIDIKGNFDMGPSKYTYEGKTINESFNSIYLRGNLTGAMWRIRPSNAMLLNNSDESKGNSIKYNGSASLGGVPKNGITLTAIIDTVNETAEGTVEPGNGATTSGPTWAGKSNTDLKYISKVDVEHMQRLPVGSYTQIENIKITTLDPKFGVETTAMIGNLPHKLNVNNINAVKELQFILPEISGVVWSSTDNSVISIDGTTAYVTRTKGMDKEVSIKATFTTDGIKYSKEYSMTVAKADNIVKYYVDKEIYYSTEIADGGNAMYIDAPAKDNMDFIGWYEKDGETAFDFNSTVNDHIDLYAKYAPKNYDICFVVDDTTYKKLTGKYGMTIEGAIPDVPVKEGWTAVGWVISGTDIIFDENTLVTGQMIIEAKYIEGVLNKCNVTFKVDGEDYTSAQVFEGFPLTLPENPIKENYVFDYWELEGSKYDEKLPVTSDLVLTAKFSPKPVTVKFYMDESMETLHSEGVGYYNTAYGTLPVPTKSTFKFVGWKLADGNDFTESTVITEEISVYAVWESAIKVLMDEDITKYTSLTGNNVEFIKPSTSVSQAYFDEGLNLMVSNSKPTSRAHENSLVARFRIPMNDYDTVNRTQLYNNKLVGDYEVAVTFDVKLSGKYTLEDGTTVNAPYALFSTGSLSNTSLKSILLNRFIASGMQSYNTNSTTTNSFNNKADDKVGYTTTYAYPTADSNGVSKDYVVKTRYNTVTNDAYLTVNDRTDVSWGQATKASYIDGFHIKFMECFRNGDFLKIKRVTVTQYDVDSTDSDYIQAMNLVNSLPESVVSDPYNVVGNIEIPSIPGVSWTSSSETIVSAKTGEVSRWYDDEEIILTANVLCGNYSYSKEYYLTVKGSSSGDRQEIINHTFDSENIENWTFVNFADSPIAGYTASDDGLVIKKLTPATEPDKTYETKRYFAFYDLYRQVDSDSYSTTETKDLKGVYDVTVDLSKYSTSKIPMNVAVGYRNGNTFYSLGMLKISCDGTKFAFQETKETKRSIDVEIEDSSMVTFRVDNIRNEICLYVDGKLITERFSYYNVLGEDAKINSVKVELDENNNADDSITVKNISVAEIVSEDIEKYSNVINAAKTIDVYDITANPQAVSGYINHLPENVDGYKVNWQSCSNQIDLETGMVFHDSVAREVILTAEIFNEAEMYPVYVKKDFKLNVRAALNSAELDKFKINQLGMITKQNNDDIRYNLDIPQVDGVVWTSSNPEIIDNNGKINDDITITESKDVVISAASNGATKEYKFTVLPRTPYINLSEGALPLGINLDGIVDAKVSSDVKVSFSYTNNNEDGKVNICDENGNVLLSMVAEPEGFWFDYRGTDYKKFVQTSADIDVIVMPDVDKAAIFVDDILVADYVSLKTNAEYVASVETTNRLLDIGEVVIATDKYGMLQANIDNFDYFDDVLSGYADSDGLSFPKSVFTDSVMYDKAVWTSSNTAVLANNGVVTLPLAMTLVDLEFRITDVENADVYIKKDFVIAVDCDNSKNLVYGKVPSVSFKDPDYPQSNISDNNTNTVFKVINSNVYDSEIIFDIGNRTSFNSIFVLLDDFGIEEYSIFVSEDGKVWNNVASGNMQGKISEFVKFANTSASYVKFVIKKCKVKEIDISELKLFFNASAAEFAQIDLETLNVPSTVSGSKITLPSVGTNGTNIVWESSNPNVISADGRVTRPKNPTTVILTAKVVVDGKEYTREFQVYVDADSSNGPSQGGGGAGGGGMGSSVTASPVLGQNNDIVYVNDMENDKIDVKNSYYDVLPTDWYYNSVIILTEKGIVSGDGTGNFNPQDNVTREQFVKMILEALEVEMVEAEIKFTDVDENAWYVDYITTAHKLNLVNGLAETHFGIGSNISRQDMAVLIERVLSYKNIEVAKEEVEPFADTTSVADYAKDAVANMKSIGLIQGYNNMYNPKDNLTRAEAATVIASLLELLAK